MVARKKRKAKKSADIPLEAIPERRTRQLYDEEFKRAAATRVLAGETAEAVARDVGVPSDSLVNLWANNARDGLPLSQLRAKVNRTNTVPHNRIATDPTQTLRLHLLNAQRDRNMRLETAAMIVEADVFTEDAGELAQRIRSFKRELAT